MSSTGLFYAHAFVSHLFIDFDLYLRSVVDSWWRAITDAVESGRTEYSSIQRMSPQFYVYNCFAIDLATTVNSGGCANNFYGKLFFTGHGATLSTAPVNNHPDNRNGSSYYIRSTEDPRKHWNIRGGYIVPSTHHRSLFTIRITDPRKAVGIVILDDDQVHISCVESQETKAISVTSDGHFALRTGDEFSAFKFGDLTSGSISERGIQLPGWPMTSMTVLSTHTGNPWSEWELILKN